MSAEQDMDDLAQVVPADTQPPNMDPVVQTINLALDEVTTLLRETGGSFGDICGEVEQATSKDDCRLAFRQFSKVVRMLLVAASAGDHDQLVKEAICSLEPREQLLTLLEDYDSVPEAITAYKKMVLQELAASIRNLKATVVVSEVQDDALFDQFLSAPQSDISRRFSRVPVVQPELSPSRPLVSKKRAISDIVDEPIPEVIPKKTGWTIPALASLSTFPEIRDGSGLSKKRALLTREKL